MNSHHYNPIKVPFKKQENCHGITVAGITYPKEICECEPCQQREIPTTPVSNNRTYEICRNTDVVIDFQLLYQGDFAIQSINLISSNMLEHGILGDITTDFKMTFTPEVNYTGTVDFDYSITDTAGNTSNISTISIYIILCEIPCNETTITLELIDKCTGLFAPISYPIDVYSPFSIFSGNGGNLGEASNYATIITLLNNDTSKPAGLQFLANADETKIDVFGTCEMPNIKLDNTTKNTIIYLPDHHSLSGAYKAQIIVTDASNNNNLGSVPLGNLIINTGGTFFANERFGDIVRVGNFIYVNTWKEYSTNTGSVQNQRLLKINISNPISPVIAGVLAIPTGYIVSYLEMETDGIHIYIGGGYAGSGGSLNIIKISIATFSVVGVINYPAGRIRTAYLDNNNIYFASNFGNDGLVHKVDKSSFTYTGNITLPSQVSLAVTGDANHVYVTGIDNTTTFDNLTVYKIDKATFTIIASYNTTKKCKQVCGNLSYHNGNLYVPVSNAVEETIVVINPLQLISVGQTTGITISEIQLPVPATPYKVVPISNCFAYVTCDERFVLKLDLNTKQVVGKVCTGGDCYNLAYVQNVDLSQPMNLDAIQNPLGSCINF